ISKEMARCRLKRLSVMHQRLDCISILRACELLALRLSSRNNRDRKVFLNEIFIYFPHHLCTLFRFLISRVDRMSFLPQELSGTKERSRRLLPAKYRTPLIPYFRQITVGLHCLAPHIAEQSLRGRTDTESLLKLLHSSVCHPCH